MALLPVTISNMLEATATIVETRVGRREPPALHLYQSRGVQPGPTGEATGSAATGEQRAGERQEKHEGVEGDGESNPSNEWMASSSSAPRNGSTESALNC